MNKIDTQYIQDPSILMPYTAGVIDFLQFANKEVVFGLAQGIAGKDALDQGFPIAIYDCISGSTTTINDGYILYGNELYYCEGHSGAFTGSAIANITVSFPYNSDPLLYTDGVPRNTLQQRHITISDGPLNSGLFNFKDVVYVDVAPYKSGLTMTNSWINTGNINTRKNKDGLVTLEGFVTKATNINGSICTLPVGYRPSANRYFTVNAVYTGSLAFDVLEITTAGLVTLQGAGSYTYISNQVFLDGICFYIN